MYHQSNESQPVRFELTHQMRGAVQAWITKKKLAATDFFFPSRNQVCPLIWR